MIDFNSKEEVIKHIQHIKNTYDFDIDNPTKIYKGEYELKIYYLGNLIYMINTKPLDIKLDDFLKEQKE
jgi:hypothetical protein